MFRNNSGIGSGEVIYSGGIIAKGLSGAGLLFFGIALLVFTMLLPSSWIKSREGVANIVAFISVLMGFSLLLWSVASVKNLRLQLLEKRTLQIAKNHKGILTPTQLAIEANINVSKANELLKDFQQKGVAEIFANEAGAVSYKFYDLIS